MICFRHPKEYITLRGCKQEAGVIIFAPEQQEERR
jgi:hypothetical protein